MPARPARLATARSFARSVRLAARPGSAGMVTRLRALPRLAAAIRRREYLGASAGNLLTLAAATLYVASPADLLPEALLGPLGLGDDALVLAYAASAFVNLTEDFLAWEAATGAPRPQHRPATTVPGSVIR